MSYRATVSVDHGSPTPAYLQLAEILRSRIAAVGTRSHGPLPSNRALRETYEVGEYVVTHAIRLLEDEGLVFTVPRRGVYVSQRANWSSLRLRHDANALRVRRAIIAAGEGEGNMQPWVVFAAVIAGIVGLLIGTRKGHPVWGFFLGFLLSVIGIVIIALAKPRHERGTGQPPRNPGPVGAYMQVLRERG